MVPRRDFSFWAVPCERNRNRNLDTSKRLFRRTLFLRTMERPAVSQLAQVLSLLLVAAFQCPNFAAAQSAELVIPGVTDTHLCDLATLEEKVVDLNGVCCFGLSGSPGSACAGGLLCTVDCASILLPLLDSCSSLLDQIFDLHDGVEDGVASVLDSTYQSCMEIDNTEALDFLSELQITTCPSDTFDGVAETEVGEAPCEDIRAGCQAGIGAGFLSCAMDFCPTCGMSGQCDRACGYCTGSAPPPPPCDDVRDNCEDWLNTPSHMFRNPRLLCLSAQTTLDDRWCREQLNSNV